MIGPCCNSVVFPIKSVIFLTFMVKLALSEKKKTFAAKSGPFDQHGELISLQDNLMVPLKPQVHKTGGLLKTDREPISLSEDSVI